VIIAPLFVDKFIAPASRKKKSASPARTEITSLLWAAFITSLMRHHFLTSWLPTAVVTRKSAREAEPELWGGKMSRPAFSVG
jgi:hypothetical protein